MRQSKVFLLLCGVGFFSFMSYNLVRMPALAPFAESLGASPPMIGYIVAASTLTGVFLKLPMGALSDLLNRDRIMMVGVMAFAFPPFAYPYVSDLDVLLPLRVVHGLATATFTPLVLARVAELFPTQRGASLGWYTSAAQGGGLLGPALGGMLIDSYGYALNFQVAGFFGLLSLGLFLLIPKRGSQQFAPHVQTREIVAEFLQAITRLIHHSKLMAISCAEASKMMANGTLMAFLPLYALSVGLSLTEGGLLFGVQGFTSFCSKPFLGRLSDRVGRRPLIVVGLILCGVTIVLIPHVSDFFILMVLAGGFGFGEAVVTSSSAAFIADVADPRDIGGGMGLRGTIMDIGHAGGPILAGALVVAMSYTGAFMVIGLVQLIAVFGFWWYTSDRMMKSQE